MFDIGFLELLVIMVIALIIIGPERMPEVARKIGQFTGKTRRFINSMKQDSEITGVINELQNSMNLEEQKKEIESVTNALEEDLTRIEKDWDVDLDDKDISRPFERDESTPLSASQFNKAPQQPAIPQPETAEQPEVSPEAKPPQEQTPTNKPQETKSQA